MDIEGVILCEVTQTEEKYHIILLNILNFLKMIKTDFLIKH